LRGAERNNSANREFVQWAAGIGKAGVSLLDRTIEAVMRDLRSSNIVWTQDDLGFTLEGGRVGLYTSDLELGEQALVKSVYVNLMI
jgi:hypothetical protein